MQTCIVKTQDGHVLGTHSWVDGFKAIKCPKRQLSEKEALAHALWIERHHSPEDADQFIEAWVAVRNFCG